MGADSCLVLYGNSVILAAIATELEHRHRFDVITLEPGCPEPLERIRALSPRAVLFDLATVPPDSILALLREWPGLLLAGVDPSSDQVLVLSSRMVPAVAPADLLEVVHGEEMKGGGDAGKGRRGDAETSRHGDARSR